MELREWGISSPNTMTLANVQRYDSDGLSDLGGHAVVVGGSVAGLLTARVLADGFDEVTILERDSLPEDPAPRSGIPQGRHIHVLETAGRETFEDLFPGYGEDLISEGGLIIDLMSDLIHYERGDYLADGPQRMPLYCASRPLFEHVLRQRVTARDSITLRSETQFIDYVFDESESRVEGVTIRENGSEELEVAAELVVDTSGRTSNTRSWLEDQGFPLPDIDEVHIDVAYSTALIERPQTDRRGLFVPPESGRPRGVVMFPIENKQWQPTLVGVHGDHPPTTKTELIDFANSLPAPEIGDILESQSWVNDNITHYPFPSNRRVRYENLKQFPDDLVVLGDAVCSFNPLYGQGMSTAALQALQLHHTLSNQGREDIGLRFFDAIEEVIDSPWTVAVGGDFEFQETTGPKPRGTDFINSYLDRFIRAAQTDGQLREALVRVFNQEEPPSSLMRPRYILRVFKPG